MEPVPTEVDTTPCDNHVSDEADDWPPMKRRRNFLCSYVLKDTSVIGKIL